jgi:hypothetical protein
VLGLDPREVSIVATPVAASARSIDHELTRFGPVTIARTSLGALRLIVAGAILLNLVLLGAIALLWSRIRKAETALADAQVASESKR